MPTLRPKLTKLTAMAIAVAVVVIALSPAAGAHPSGHAHEHGSGSSSDAVVASIAAIALLGSLLLALAPFARAAVRRTALARSRASS